MNVNIGRSDVIILLLNYKWDECEWVRSLQFGGYYYFGPEVYKWDECECCISFAVWRVLFCHLIINGMNVNIE
jgi:hypothetical protein